MASASASSRAASSSQFAQGRDAEMTEAKSCSDTSGSGGLDFRSEEIEAEKQHRAKRKAAQSREIDGADHSDGAGQKLRAGLLAVMLQGRLDDYFGPPPG